MKDPWETFLAAKREAQARTLETRRKNERRRYAEGREAYRARQDLLAAAQERFGNADKLDR